MQLHFFHTKDHSETSHIDLKSKNDQNTYFVRIRKKLTSLNNNIHHS